MTHSLWGALIACRGHGQQRLSECERKKREKNRESKNKGKNRKRMPKRQKEAKVAMREQGSTYQKQLLTNIRTIIQKYYSQILWYITAAGTDSWTGLLWATCAGTVDFLVDFLVDLDADLLLQFCVLHVDLARFAGGAGEEGEGECSRFLAFEPFALGVAVAVSLAGLPRFFFLLSALSWAVEAARARVTRGETVAVLAERVRMA